MSTSEDVACRIRHITNALRVSKLGIDEAHESIVWMAGVINGMLAMGESVRPEMKSEPGRSTCRHGMMVITYPEGEDCPLCVLKARDER